ncbi:hypothetical protein [Thalassomonas haliotis]|uniref:Uncharacterized protein n=1 Tax=Thalassomonas haliotis TaxID=485448 RepID=A0ABY7VBU7_9GAMM|nr:hypothetical protein [Thalassomonas haliotis]WDE11008.1 hypothetical protein H3N35_22645 [Thalassomonas haliotis]
MPRLNFNNTKYLILFVLALLLTSVSVLSKETKQLAEEFKLEMNPSSSMAIPNFHAKVYSDGSITLSGEGEYGVGKPTMVMQYEVDIKNKSYSTTVVDPSTLDEETFTHQEVTNRINLEPKALKLMANREQEGIFPSVNTGYWQGRVRVRTYDIPRITLTETSNQLQWYVFSDGTVCWTSYSLAWYAVNPSPLDTHWFIEDAAHYGPYPLAANTQSYHRMTGDYYNFDWGLDSWKTSVHQTASITARNDAMFNYSWGHTDSGEDSAFIYGSVILN